MLVAALVSQIDKHSIRISAPHIFPVANFLYSYTIALNPSDKMPLDGVKNIVLVSDCDYAHPFSPTPRATKALYITALYLIDNASHASFHNILRSTYTYFFLGKRN